ncbi:ATP-binding protein [Providencia sp. JUb39]|uniref:ATP-binding protein n=2 Tax=Enterobacterales TaxID=91347 RepID=UPI00164ED060|nr:ATP-binding protein [Providencia sp. JUb39]MBC5791254.1 response regulator [Providencia sp. JUb39]
MPNKLPTAFSRITRSSGRTNSILTVTLPLLLVLIATLFWSANRIVHHETRRLEVEFKSFIGYLLEQEVFLKALNKQNQDLSELLESRTYSINDQFLPKDWPLRLLEGKESIVAMPFTLACGNNLECSRVPSILFSLGAYLADFYSTFWGRSYYPAAAVFFINEHDYISISVPSVGTLMGNTAISPELFRAVTDSIRDNVPLINKRFASIQHDGQEIPVIWLKADKFKNNLLGIVPAGFDANLWQNAHLSPKNIYAVSLLSKDHLSVLEKVLNPTLRHEFWLLHDDFGLLLGDSPVPLEPSEGIFYTQNGLVMKLSFKDTDWIGYYRISYAAFFEDNMWLPISLVISLLFSLLCGWGYKQWYHRKILQPAILSQQVIVESEAFNQTLIATTPIGLCVIDKETQDLRFANELAQHWLNIPNTNFPRDSIVYNELLSRVISDQKQVTTVLKSGEHVLYIVSTATQYQQRPVILCAFTDITIQAETEKQLNHAKRLAEEANQAKSNFLATMSHEIRTPLYGIIGTLELLENTALSPKQKHFIDRMSTTSQLLMHLIGDILDISKMEANQIHIQHKSFDLLDLIQQTVQLYQGLAQQKKLLLFAIIDPDIYAARIGDATRLQQIFGNLVSNAIKFTHNGKVTIELRNGTNNNIILFVNDTGVGISQEQQEKLFEPFYQAHSGQHTYGGTGLGLFICAELVKLMGGEISVTSELMVGSSFQITLPLEFDQNNIQWKSLAGSNIWLRTIDPLLTSNIYNWLIQWGAKVYFTEAELPEDTSSVIAVSILIQDFSLPQDWHGKIWVSDDASFRLSEFNQQLFLLKNKDNSALPLTCPILQTPSYANEYSLRVLVAEDNPINQVTLQEQLELLGCEVFMASDGEEALVVWDNQVIDIILTDVNMPYRNGYELTKQLRSEGETCPIIGVTANGLKDEEERCLAAGMDTWLVKPIDLETLVKLFNRFFPIYSSIIPSDTVTMELINPLDSSDRANIIQHFTADIHDLYQAVNDNNIDVVKQLSHRIRGALVSVKQRDFASRLQVLEERLSRETTITNIAETYMVICDELTNWLNQINQTNGV